MKVTQHNNDDDDVNDDKQLMYLEKWKNDRINWKFNKTTQSKLVRQWPQTSYFSKTHFKLFLEYITQLKGQSRLHLFRQAKTMMRQQKKKVKTDAIKFVLEFMERDELKKLKGLDREQKDAQILKMEAAKKFIGREMKEDTLYKRARAVYNVLVLTDEDQGSTLANESGEDDDDDDNTANE
jgi:hypothetical protein